MLFFGGGPLQNNTIRLIQMAFGMSHVLNRDNDKGIKTAMLRIPTKGIMAGQTQLPKIDSWLDT